MQLYGVRYSCVTGNLCVVNTQLYTELLEAARHAGKAATESALDLWETESDGNYTVSREGSPSEGNMRPYVIRNAAGLEIERWEIAVFNVDI